MPEIERTETFDKCYLSLHPDIQRKVIKALRLLAADPRYPSLQSEPVQGAPGIYEARVDDHYRFTYERLPGNVLRVRVVGPHDEVLKKP
jgi:mRNA interferase RelE/StbE